MSVRYLSCGDTAFTVEFGNEISPEINGRVMALHAAIARESKSGGLPGVVETVPTIRSLMVSYDPLKTTRATLEPLIAGLIAYNTQKLKMTYYYLKGDADSLAVQTNYGALNLYLDFINLFLFLLRIFGSRR